MTIQAIIAAVVVSTGVYIFVTGKKQLELNIKTKIKKS